LAFYEERAQQVRDKVRGAMVYPGVIVTVAIGAIAALLTLVVPTFEGMFAASGQELPFATLLLVNASDFLAENWPYLTVAILFGVLAVRALYSTAPIRLLAHRIVLHTPVVGRLVRKVAVARLSRTLASLLTSGVSILDALAAGARTAGNLVIENAILESRDGVAQGMEISVALSRHSVLPSLVSGMVGVGEQTGQLDQMLGKGRRLLRARGRGRGRRAAEGARACARRRRRGGTRWHRSSDVSSHLRRDRGSRPDRTVKHPPRDP
jgi:type IV pilus assembly protein PilC